MSNDYNQLKKQINYLYKRVKCLEKDCCDGGSSGGDLANQNNVFKVFTTNSVTLNSNTGVANIDEVVAAVNAVATTVDETNNIFFKVPLNVISTNTVRLYNEVYKLVGLGKGNYGLGGTPITEDNLLLDFSTGDVTIDSTFQLPPEIFEFTSVNWETPSTAVNNQVGPFVIDNTKDYYFKIFEQLSTRPIGGNYKLYLFQGANGTYGSGQTATVPGDFQLIDTERIEVNTRDLGIKVRTIDIGAVINGNGVLNDDISKAVNRSFRGLISIGPLEVVKFGAIKQEIRTRALDGTKETTLIYEKYNWTRGIAIIASDSTIDDFDIEYSKAITSNILTGLTGDPKVHVILGTDLDAPQDALNSSSDAFTTSSAEKSFFVVYSPQIGDNLFKVYQFDGADNTYGSGQPGTAILGDFTLVTTKSPNETTLITKTSQLINDGDDGSNRFVTEDDLADPGTGDPPFLRQVALELSAAQIQNINSAPVVAVQAPGAGLGIEVISASVQFDWGTVQFDGGSDLFLKCSTAPDVYSQFRFDPSFLNNTNDAFARMLVKAEVDLEQVIENDSLVVSGNLDSTVGDSTIKVFFIYRIIDLT